MEPKTFLWKILRNAFILSGIQFFTLWSVKELYSFADIKPVCIFLGLYVLTEIAHYYHIREAKGNNNILLLF